MKCDCCDKQWGNGGLQSIKVKHHLWTALKWKFEWKCHFHSDRTQRDCLIQMDKALLINLGRIPHQYKELHNIQRGKLIITWFKLNFICLPSFQVLCPWEVYNILEWVQENLDQMRENFWDCYYDHFSDHSPDE